MESRPAQPRKANHKNSGCKGSNRASCQNAAPTPYTSLRTGIKRPKGAAVCRQGAKEHAGLLGGVLDTRAGLARGL